MECDIGESVECAIDGLAARMDGHLVVSSEKINWADAGKTFKYASLFKLASGKAINKDRFEEVTVSVWKLEEEASFVKVENNMILVNFKALKDQSKILDGGSWTMDNGALLMQKWESGMISEYFCNNKINIWVQLHRLPFELRSQTSVKELAELTGRVKDTKDWDKWSDTTYRGEFPKFRIELATDEPILPDFFLKRETRKPV